VLEPEQRATLAALADVLIPATEAMPSASAAGAHEKWLDRALAARPELAPVLSDIAGAARARDPAEEVRRLHEEEPRAFDALALAVSGA
jgi:hypothetical protein